MTIADANERRRWARYHAEVKPALRWQDVYPAADMHGKDDDKRMQCPMHTGAHADSLSVKPSTLEWNCFGSCGGGGPVEWLVAREGMTEEQARDHLAELAGVDLDAPAPSEPAVADAERAFVAECARRKLDPERLRSEWGCRPGIHYFPGPRPAFEFPTPNGVPRLRMLDGKEPKTPWLPLKQRTHRGITARPTRAGMAWTRPWSCSGLTGVAWRPTRTACPSDGARASPGRPRGPAAVGGDDEHDD